MHHSEMKSDVRRLIAEGTVLPAHPLALDASRALDTVHQRALTRYYIDAGAGGLAVGVHTTQFAIRDVGIYKPVLELAAETAASWTKRPLAMVAGLAGPTQQAVAEAKIARGIGYHAGLLSLAAMKSASEDEIIAHCEAVAREIPLVGCCLQPAVGGVILGMNFWRRFAQIDNVVAIKIAPFHRYRTLDVLRGVAAAGALDRITLYTGNDDHILLDLTLPFDLRDNGVTLRTHFLAVSDVTMDVQEGELISLVGPSGCGKTTVLKILAGLHDSDGGTIKIGNSKTSFNPARDIGMVFQQALLLKWRTVLDNVLLPAEIVGLPMQAARTRAKELLELVGLAGYEDKYPQQLSGGMQQRTAIARAFIHDPKLILMDEPFGALDALTREQMNLEMLRIWRESGKTIIFVTHSIQEAVFLASHCAVLSSGPARMAEYFPIELPFPRPLAIETPGEFGAYARRLYASLGLA